VADIWVERCAGRKFMTTMDGDACVVDTNVIIYSTVSGNPWHHQARQWLATLQGKGCNLCVTTQILREYLVVLTRGTVFEKSFSIDQVLAQIQTLLSSLAVLDEPLEAADLLRTLAQRYQVRGKNIHDANIVAVMLTHGVRRLATYNQADFQRFDEIALEAVPVEEPRESCF
jgi:predicted nucleic acid-binding protein